MRIAELARRSSLPVSRVKFYLREGLLPAVEATAATQAQYDEAHVARLGLITALLGAAQLSIAQARKVLAVIDNPASSVHDSIGAAHHVLPAPFTSTADELDEARAHLTRWGWIVEDNTPALTVLSHALHALRTAGLNISDAVLDRYARAAGELAVDDVAEIPVDSVADAVRVAVVGTLLLEPVLLALRRLAQEDASAKRFSHAPSAW